MSHHPESYLLKISNEKYDPSKVEKYGEFHLYLVPKVNGVIENVRLKDIPEKSRQFSYEFLDKKLSAVFENVYQGKKVSVPALFIDVEHHEKQFNLENGSCVFAYLFDIPCLMKKSVLEEYNIDISIQENIEKIMEMILDYKLIENQDYFYIFNQEIKEIEKEISVYHFKTEKDIDYYEYTKIYFSLDEALNLVPQEMNLEDSFMYFIVKKEDADKFCQEPSLFEDRYVKDWQFKENENLIFFNAP